MTAQPTTDLEQAKHDLAQHGFCMLAGALSQQQIAAVRERLIAQARAEISLGDAFEDGGADQQWGAFRDGDGNIRPEAFTAKNGGVNQRVWMLVNKGRVFLDLLEHERVLSLVRSVLGDELLLSSHSANIAKSGGIAMPLHTDQWWMPQPTRKTRSPLPVGSITRSLFDSDDEYDSDVIAPAACSNVIWMLDDFTSSNGATRIVPGTHMSGRHPDAKRDAGVESIPACAPAGTALVTDGRVWHGTGANIGNTSRHAVLSTFCGPQFRPQENYVVGTRREVLDDATPSLRALLGLKVWCGYGRTGNPTVEYIDPSDTPQGIVG